MLFPHGREEEETEREILDVGGEVWLLLILRENVREFPPQILI